MEKKMQKTDILAVGTVAYDDIETPFGKKEKALGGSAVHFSIPASILANVSIVSVIGEDFEKKHIEFLNSLGIDTTLITEIKGEKTFHWSGYYEYDMNVAHTRKTELNVLEKFSPKIDGIYREPNVLFLANISPSIQLSVLSQIDNSKVWIKAMDTMNFWIENSYDELMEVIKKVDILFINDAEIRLLTKTASLIKAGKKLIEYNPNLMVIIKKGEHGAILIEKDHLFSIPSFPIEDVKDPTGAGDSFAGAFLSFLVKQGKLSEQIKRQALAYSVSVASFYIEGFGIEGFIGKNYTDIKTRYNTLREYLFFEPLE
jgi:ribokinase